MAIAGGASARVLVLTGEELPSLHLVYGLTPLAVSFFAEQLRLIAAQTELDRRNLEGRAAIEALPEAERSASSCARSCAGRSASWPLPRSSSPSWGYGRRDGSDP